MNITVVYGPPRSGKSAYIQKNKQDGDTVISFESAVVGVNESEFWSQIGKHGDEFRREIVWQLCEDFLKYAVRQLHDIPLTRDVWIESPFCREWVRAMFFSRVKHLFPDASWTLVYCQGDLGRAKQVKDPMPEATLCWLYDSVDPPSEREKCMNIVEIEQDETYLGE